MGTVFNGVEYNDRHGGPFDRGVADSYYNRDISPHYYVGNTGMTDRIGFDQMTLDEIAEYIAGYNWNEEFGDKKEY